MRRHRPGNHRRDDAVLKATDAAFGLITDGLFLEQVRKVAKDFPEVRLDEVIIDATSRSRERWGARHVCAWTLGKEAIMLRCMTLAAAAIAVTSPALADDTCLTDVRGAQCDMFLEQYRADEIPVGITNVWASEDFLLKRYQDFRPDSAVEFPTGEDVLYWDGDSAMIIPEESGPRLEVADW